jgi:hypothetical protein
MSDAIKKKLGVFCICFLVVFQHMVFDNNFLIIVKELGFLTSTWE